MARIDATNVDGPAAGWSSNRRMDRCAVCRREAPLGPLSIDPRVRVCRSCDDAWRTWCATHSARRR